MRRLCNQARLQTLYEVISVRDLVTSVRTLQLSIRPTGVSGTFLSDVGVFPINVLLVVGGQFFSTLYRVGAICDTKSTRISPVCRVCRARALPIRRVPRFGRGVLPHGVVGPVCDLRVIADARFYPATPISWEFLQRNVRLVARVFYRGDSSSLVIHYQVVLL